MSSAPTFTPSAYGADDQGLICGYLFEPGRPGRPMTAPEAQHWQADAGKAAGAFVWLHFNLSHAAAEPWLRAHGTLPDDFFEALHEGSRSTRIERSGAALFGVINDVTFDFSFEASDVATLWLSVSADRVISARRHPLRSIDRLRHAVKRGEPLASSVVLLDHLLRDQADELQGIARRAGERVDDIEDEMLAGKAGQHAAELPRLRRMTVRLQRLLAPEPSALLRTLGHPPGWVAPDDMQSLRRASEDFAVTLRDIATLQERIKLLQEESATRVAEENNRSLFVLTMVTVLALPINLIAGLLGMNVGGIPLSQHGHGFWWILLIVLALTAGLGLFLFRRLGPRR